MAADAVRQDAGHTVHALQQRGLRVLLISGMPCLMDRPLCRLHCCWLHLLLRCNSIAQMAGSANRIAAGCICCTNTAPLRRWLAVQAALLLAAYATQVQPYCAGTAV